MQALRQNIDRPTSSAPKHPLHPTYRADIDGLRAIAVLSVVGFHAFPQLIPGGFVGVDIFFVISGFLISKIIASNLDAGTFSFVEFYGRRIRRIFPALLLVLMTCFLFGWFSLLSDEYKQLGKHIATGAGFIANFALRSENSYFDNAAETKPLLHLWSLGVEEQFYIVWPLLLWAGWKNRIRPLTLALIIAGSCFSLNIWTIHVDPIFAFYSPQTRFWELSIGAIYAFWKRNEYQNSITRRIGQFINIHCFPSQHLLGLGPCRFRNVQSCLGASLIAVSIIFITSAQAFPGWLALFPTLGTILIISSGPQAWVNRTVLSNPVLVWFGLISFPLYLWHWPLLCFLRIIENAPPSLEARLSVLLVSIALSWLTFKWIEKPVRRATLGKTTTIVLAALMIVVGYIGYNDYHRDGLKFRVREFEEISKAAGEWRYPGDMKRFTFENQVFFLRSSETPKTTLFIGDSNIQQYYVRIDQLIKENPSSINNAIFATDGGCTPIPHLVRNKGINCIDLLKKSVQLAASRSDISTVVIGAQWFTCLAPGNCYLEKDGIKYSIAMRNRAYYEALASLKTYLDAFTKGGKQVFLVLNIPVGKENDPKYMAERSLKNFPRILKLRKGGIQVQALKDMYGYILEDLTDVGISSAAAIIDPMQYLCSQTFCPNIDNAGLPIYKDQSHLRPYFVRSNATFIDQTVSQ